MIDLGDRAQTFGQGSAPHTRHSHVLPSLRTVVAAGVGAHLEDLPGGGAHQAHALHPAAGNVPAVDGAGDALHGEGDLAVGDGGRRGRWQLLDQLPTGFYAPQPGRGQD